MTYTAASRTRHLDLTEVSIKGQLITEILKGVGQRAASPPNLSAEALSAIAPLLLKSGGGAVGWWRVRQTELRSTRAAQELQQAYRLHTLEAAIKEGELGQLYTFLRSHGLEPLLGKGWVIAGDYPELGLRPYGDFDLYVRPEEHAALAAALSQPAARGWYVDLHYGAAELDDRSFDELYTRSRPAPLGAVSVRTFGPEDHLRLLCLHMLREGALRPLWLCDIAVALSALPANFDWDYFLSGDRRRADWAICAIGLAHQLLGAEVNGLPIARRAQHLPRWLAPTVLAQWGAGRMGNGRRRPMASYLRQPAGWLAALRLRWPNPIEATVTMQGQFNNWPRLPHQLGACVVRTAHFVRQLPGSVVMKR